MDMVDFAWKSADGHVGRRALWPAYKMVMVTGQILQDDALGTMARDNTSLNNDPENEGNRRKGFWLLSRKGAMFAAAALLMTAGAVSGGVLLRQDMEVTTNAQAADIVFARGLDAAAIEDSGFGALSVASSGASAALTVSAVSGAAAIDFSGLMSLNNEHASKSYNVQLVRSAALSADISEFNVTVMNGLTQVAQWDALADESSAQFAVAAGSSLDVRITYGVKEGVAAGTLGTFVMEHHIEA